MSDHHQPSTSISREVDTRPEFSPHASPVVTLRFRNGGSLYIARELLEKCPRIASHCKPRSHFNPGSPECSESHVLNVTLDIGHVLVHFLITGSYQCLKPKQTSVREMNASEFTTALRVYSAAQSFNLPLLGDLAGGEIRRLGEELSLPHIIDIMEGENEEPFHIPWIAIYVESRVQSFFNIPTRKVAKQLLSELEAPATGSKLILRSMIALRSRELPCEKETEGEEDLRAGQSVVVQPIPTKDDAESSQQSHSSTILDQKRISPDTSLVLTKIDVSAPIPDVTTDYQAICVIEPAHISDSSQVVTLTKKQKKKLKREERQKKQKEQQGVRLSTKKAQKEEKRRKAKETKQERDTAGSINAKRSSLDGEESVRPASVLGENSKISETQRIDIEWTLLDDLGELEDDMSVIAFPTDEILCPEEFC